MEKYKEYNGVWFYKTDKDRVTIRWTTSYESSGKMSKTFINEESAIKYIDNNNISDYINNNRMISQRIHKGLIDKNKKRKS